jgi:TRAP-type uncharacterized transport system fused permease subunit
MFIGVPAVILQGNARDILIAIVAETIGILCMVASLEGYLIKHWGIVSRIVLGVASILLLFPEPITDLIGLGLIILAFVLNTVFKPRGVLAPAAKSETTGAKR